MERARAVLLPFCFVALCAGDDGSLASRGPHVSRPFQYEKPALRGGARRVLLRGAVPDVAGAPWLLVAARPDASTRSYDRLAHHLASHGCAALVATRLENEAWHDYAGAVAQAIWQVRTAAATEGSPFHGRFHPGCVLLVGDGDGAAAAARVASDVEGLRALVLIDPPEPGPALAWLPRVSAPVLAIATSARRVETTRRWLDAAGADPDEKWLVELEVDRPQPGSRGDPDSLLERDLRALISAFAAAELRLGDGPALDFDAAARRGEIDRKVHRRR